MGPAGPLKLTKPLEDDVAQALLAAASGLLGTLAGQPLRYGQVSDGQ